MLPSKSTITKEKRSGLQERINAMKESYPALTKKEAFDFLISHGFNFQGKSPKRAVHMAWINLGYARKGKQQSLPGIS